MPIRIPAWCDNSIFLFLVPCLGLTPSCTYKYDKYGHVCVGEQRSCPGCRKTAMPQWVAPVSHLGACPGWVCWVRAREGAQVLVMDDDRGKSKCETVPQYFAAAS